MKQYVYKGKTYDNIPDPLEIGTGTISPVTEETFIRYGGKIVTVVTAQEQEFYNACQGFRYLCYQVRILSGDHSFTGGIDEMRDLLKTDIATRYPTEFQRLSTLFTWYDKECTYIGGRLGYNQPGWWYKCWEIAPKYEYQMFLDPTFVPPIEEQTNPYDGVNEPEAIIYDSDLEDTSSDEIELNPYDIF